MTPLLEVEDLEVQFRTRRAGRHVVQAVAGVSLEIGRGEVFALVGESGSGKSTTARAILRLVDVAAGRIRFDGDDVTALSRQHLKSFRRRVQMVFQDPYSSLDPSTVIGDSIAEPLEVHERLTRHERDERVVELLDLVGLAPEARYRYPHEFSGGQRQRIAIARALALRPDLIICDEAVSALDVSTQNQILDLLMRLARTLSMSYLFITHDLAVVRHMAHRVAIMYLGTIVEQGPVDDIFAEPTHPYTKALLSAVPLPDPVRQAQRQRIVLTGDLPDPSDPPAGCRFHTRCPEAVDLCRSQVPPVIPVGSDHVARCHLVSPTPLLTR